MTGPAEELTRRTIDDFGDQWTRYTSNEGFYASLDLWRDVLGPLATPDDFKDATVADIGSGTGRIVGMLMACGARHVLAVEPSEAVTALRRTVAPFGPRVEILQARGEDLPPDRFDWVVSYGVLHHIPDPDPVMRAAFTALKPGGRVLIWLYGHEGNEAYLALVGPLRWLTTRLPHPLLAALSHGLTGAASAYALACRLLPLPLAGYMRQVFGKLDWRARFLTVYDQLNPAWAKYYRRAEAVALLERAGFADIRLHHRGGYSWTVSGVRSRFP